MDGAGEGNGVDDGERNAGVAPPPEVVSHTVDEHSLGRDEHKLGRRVLCQAILYDMRVRMICYSTSKD